MLWMPGTSPSRIELMDSSLAAHSVEPETVPSGAWKVPSTHLSLRSRFSRIPSASVMAVPLGASILWMWCVSLIEPGEFSGQMYPLNLYTKWDRNNYGPIWIPAKGATIKLTEDNLPIYERCIVAYEGNKLEVKEDGIYINGEKTDSYTFNMDYYWMMGDNRDKSADSRYWGFVPEDHVVGKPIVVWLSLDKDRGWFDGKIRWNRIFKWVDGIK